MTLEQLEKGNDILKMLKIWEEKYSQYQIRSLSRVVLQRNCCGDTDFRNSGDDLSVKFVNDVEIMYGKLCREQIARLEKQLEEL